MKTVIEKKRILNTPGLRGEIKIVVNTKSFNYPISCHRNRISEELSCMMIGNNKENHIWADSKNILIWQNGICEGYLEQKISYKNVTILWCVYDGIIDIND